jgi:hypothetical protein
MASHPLDRARNAAKMAKLGPTAKYEIRVEFDAPVRFAYRWCTDFSTEDAKHEGEKYARRILSHSARKVVYEDLEDTPQGWSWTRHVVALAPPDHWHSESVGNRREISLDYRLKALSNGRSQLRLTAQRRATEIGGKNPTKAAWDKSVRASWANFGRALERDYRNSRGPGRRRRSQ